MDGSWSAWRPGAPEDEDAPDVGSHERRRSGWKLGNPFWVGASDRIQARALGKVTRVRAHLVWSPELRVPYRVPAATVAPPIVPRLSWDADESIRRGPPSYATGVRFAVVHHTAGRNDYTRAEAAAIVKGIQLFHVQGNGWNDIGYNFLVDRFGTVYEGRFGGIDRNVVGAHAQGFNTGSVGIALLGTYGSTRPSAAAQEAIARLVAWRLDLAHVDPTSFLTFISGGSNRYASGIPVLLSAVTGHRDTGFTECPGDALEARLPAIAGTALDLGGLKIFEPTAETLGSSVRVRARLSRPDAWAVVVTSASEVEIARGTGTGTSVDWTWDSAGTPAGSYRWTVAAGAARPATGILRAGGGALPLAIESMVAEPETISPNGDGQADSTVLTYRISGPANVTVEITDAVEGVVATVVDRVWMRAGQHAVTDRRSRARRRPVQRRRDCANRVRRLGSEADPAERESHPRARNGGARGVLAQRRRPQGPSHDDVLACGTGRRAHPHRARGPVGRQPARGELPGRDSAPRSGMACAPPGGCGTASTALSWRRPAVPVRSRSVFRSSRTP